MGIFKREPSIDQLEEKRERVKIETDIASGEAQIAERKAVIAQLKKTYGGGWMKLLGVRGNTDTSTLKSFLSTSKKGMEKATKGMDSTRKRLWGNLGEG